MDPDHIQATAARDQLWASLRVLVPEIDEISKGHLDGSERQLQIIQLLARIVSAELNYRAGEAE